MNAVTQSLTKLCHYSLLGLLTFSSCSCTSGIQRHSTELWSLSVLYSSANVAHSDLMVCWQNTSLPPLGKWKAVPFSEYFSTLQLRTWRLSSPQLPKPCTTPGDATGWHHVCLSVCLCSRQTLWGGIRSITVSIYLIKNPTGSERDLNQTKNTSKHLQEYI